MKKTRPKAKTDWKAHLAQTELEVQDTATETIIHIEPHAKPRMTQRDKWNPTEAAKRYFNFRTLIQAAQKKHKIELPDVLSVTFICEVPKSVSKKKRAEMLGRAKQTRPDLSNYVKALEDCLADEDAYIWRYENVEKIWGESSMIVIRK